MANENLKPLLQLRKIVGDKSSKKGMPRFSPTAQKCSQETIKERNKLQRAKKEEVTLNCRSYETLTKREIVGNRTDKEKRHIVQTKKTKYSHLLSSQKHVMPNEEDISPVVYKTENNGQDRKEVATLWLQQIRVVDEC